ncbi:MAG: hypothetical protein ACYTKD_27735 [Planctomycetota bacterium]
MDPGILAERMKETAERLGMEVRECPPESEGGTVLLKGKRVVFIPHGTLASRRIQLVARALAEVDTEGVFLLPAVREAVERARGGARG